MRTRRGACYPGVISRMCSDVRVTKKNKDLHMHVPRESNFHSRKRQKNSPEKTAAGYEFFESLPDDLVISIFCKLSSTASSPSDFINVSITCVIFQHSHYFSSLKRSLILVLWNRCKRLNKLALHSLVLSKASPRTFAIKAKDWCDSAHRFLKLCADAGNIEACYTLGMVSIIINH